MDTFRPEEVLTTHSYLATLSSPPLHSIPSPNPCRMGRRQSRKSAPSTGLPGISLYPDESFWRDHQEWLAECGYLLRPRYRSDQQPFLKKSEKASYTLEMAQSPMVSIVRTTRVMKLMTDSESAHCCNLRAGCPAEGQKYCFVEEGKYLRSPSRRGNHPLLYNTSSG